MEMQRQTWWITSMAAAALFCARPEAKSIIVSNAGLPGAAGTLAAPATLAEAIVGCAPGDSILMRGGTYAFNVQITIERDNSGSAGKMKFLFPYRDEKPVLDFSTQPYGKEGNPRGLQINGSYWHVKGLEAKGSADNGIFVAGSHNIIESCVTHKNRDSGLQISRWKADAPKSEWPSHNLILNCVSYDNYDLPPGGGENADGFACKLTSGEGNVFRGCVAHNNIDDGWDLYTKGETGAIGVVVIDRCIAYGNGTLTDGTSNESGDRNGFKLGGEKIAVPHIVTRSVAYGNGKNGFTWNSNPGAIRMINNLAFDNAEGNFKFGDNSTPTEAQFANNLSIWTSGDGITDKRVGTDVGGSNFWCDKSKGSLNAKGLAATMADFATPLAPGKAVAMAAAGPDFRIFRLAAGSKLIDAGVAPTGELPFAASRYYRGMPDIGAYEDGSTDEGTTSLASAPARRRNGAGMAAGPGLYLRTGSGAGGFQGSPYDVSGRAILQAARPGKVR